MNRIGGTLFGLPFAAVGVGMLAWTALSVSEGLRAQGWQRVDATVLSGGFRTHTGEDSDTYEAWGQYRYEFGGVEYTSTRVSLHSASDNIGSFQKDLGSRISDAAVSGRPMAAWVNPENPADAVLDRSLRWGFQVFKSVFGLVFGGVGFGVIWGAWRVAPLKEAAREQRGRRTGGEWLANPDWQGEPIRSEARGAMGFAWVFAIFWNVISFPAGYLVLDAFMREGNAFALIGLLFPVVGVGLAAWAVRVSREWWRFGPAPVELDPFPGSIGGHVGGRIRLNTPVDPSQRFELTLSLIHSRRGSESRSESAKWQRTQYVTANAGSTIEFRFEVPEGLAESDTDTTGNYHEWRLHALADMAGPDFDRDYVIPVFATGTQSAGVRARDVETTEGEQRRFDDEALDRLLRIERTGMYPNIVLPPGRRPGVWLVSTLFGVVFAGIGYALLAYADDAPLLIGLAFTAIGGLVALIGIYSAGKSLRVSRDGATIRVRRSWLGIPLGARRIDLTRILHFRADRTMSAQSGGRHTVYFALYLVDEDGEARVGEGLKGHNEVEAMVRRLTRELQLPELGLEQKSMRSVLERFEAQRGGRDA